MEIVRLVFRNRKIKVVGVVCAVLWAVAGTQALVTVAQKGDMDITEAFATSDEIKITGCTIDVTGELPYDRSGFEENSERIVGELSNVYYEDTLIGEGKAPDIDRTDEMCRTEFVTDDYDMSIAVVWSPELQHTYMHIVTHLKKSVGQCSDVKSSLEDLLDEYGMDYVTYVGVSAFCVGRANEAACREYSRNIMNRLGAVPVADQSGAAGILYTSYGYSDTMGDYILSDEDRVNVQICFSYNEQENLTEINVGTPIINASY